MLGNPAEDTLLPDTISKLTRLGIRPREIALDGGFNPGPTRQTLAEHDLAPERVFIAGRQQPGSRRTQRRLQRYRTGAEAGSVTSNAATAWTDPASRETKTAKSGPDGRSWPTTPRSPSATNETLNPGSI